MIVLQPFTTSFPGSAWERNAPEAPPQHKQAEPAVHWVTRQSLVTSMLRCAIRSLLVGAFMLAIAFTTASTSHAQDAVTDLTQLAERTIDIQLTLSLIHI